MKKDYALSQFQTQAQLGRVLSETRENYQIGRTSGDQVLVPKVYGQIPYVVGDVVELVEKDNRILIQGLFLREQVVQKSANRTAKDAHRQAGSQILAANVDQLFILIALDQNFSLSKVERFVLVFDKEGLDLHVLLTKKDLCSDALEQVGRLKKLYPRVSFQALSIYDSSSIEALKTQLLPGKIGLMIGASGAGKSSLLNSFLGIELEKTKQVKKKDGKGKHTTTATTLHSCEDLDYYLIDSPGFKGIDRLEEVSAVSLFEDIVSLSQGCKFSDCSHQTEPVCAVKEAVVRGELSQDKLDRYHYQAANIASFKAK